MSASRWTVDDAVASLRRGQPLICGLVNPVSIRHFKRLCSKAGAKQSAFGSPKQRWSVRENSKFAKGPLGLRSPFDGFATLDERARLFAATYISSIISQLIRSYRNLFFNIFIVQHRAAHHCAPHVQENCSQFFGICESPLKSGFICTKRSSNSSRSASFKPRFSRSWRSKSNQTSMNLFIN